VAYTWSRFTYLCRRLQADLHESQTVRECLDYYGNQQAISLYTEQQPSSSLAREIEYRLAELPDRTAALKAASIYSRIDIPSNPAVDLQYKRAFLYLIYICVVFSVVSYLYATEVLPGMSKIYTLVDLPVSPGFQKILEYGWVSSVVILLLLVFALLIGFKLQRAFNYAPEFGNDFIVKLFVFPSIRKAHSAIIEALMFPVDSVRDSQWHENGNKQSLVHSHLTGIKLSGMSVASEIETIVVRQSAILSRQCERQIRLLTIAIGLKIVYLLFQFLTTAYIPIFKIGDAF